MKNIVNYSDVGFGDANINFLSSPFDQIGNTSIVLNGFGNPEFASLESNTYFNNKNLNFGSVNPVLSKVLVKYEYEEIYEKSKVLIGLLYVHWRFSNYKNRKLATFIMFFVTINSCKSG